MAFEFNLDSIGAKAGDIGSTILTWGIIIIGGIVGLGVIGFVVWALLKRKRWNLVVEIKMPRTDGQEILRERAKGHWDIKAGIIDIKRKKLKAVGMRPFKVQKYLQGSNFLEVLQVGPTDFIPILPKSYTTVKNEEYVICRDKDGKIIKDKDGKNKVEKKLIEYATLEIETNLEKRRTWKNYMERSAKNRFTISGFLDKHWRAIEMSIILFVIFLGISILWMRMPSICG